MPARPSARLGYVKCVRYCTDAVVHATQVAAGFLAFLLGMHFMLTLHFLRKLTSESEQQAPANTDPVRSRDLIRLRLRRSPDRLNPVQLSAIELHTLDGAGVDEESGDSSGFLTYLQKTSDVLAAHLYTAIDNMVDRIEARGGTASHLLARMRRCESNVSQDLISRLPAEIVNHILLLAATPDHLGSAGTTSTNIALLSKAHHRLVTQKLYANVHLTNALSFRRFRMTLALHNPELGLHVRSLSIASSRFDAEGYLPDQVAEHITLGVGIEQILLASPHLQHLFLDLFSLAALHNGTGSRLEKGALPISLTTEFSMPQYLTLPTFLNLKHVELTVFGLDNNAVDWFRQVLPRLSTLALRWVSRRNSARGSRASDAGHVSLLRAGRDETANSSDDEDCSEAERDSWREGGRRRQDMLLFVEAIEILRRWPFHEGQEASGTRLDSVSIIAWPKAFRELREYYRARDGITFAGEEQGDRRDEQFWNRSLGVSSLEKEMEAGRNVKEGREALRRPPDEMGLDLQTALNSSQATPLPPAPLRIAVDPAYLLGPRRGPLYHWCEQRKASVWGT